MIHKYRTQFHVSSEGAPASVEEFQLAVRSWLEGKGEKLPPGSVESPGDVTLCDSSSVSVRHDIVDNEEQWALRYRRTDEMEPLVWVVDVAISRSDDSALACIAMGVELEEHRAVSVARRLRPPAIVARLAQNFDLTLGCPITTLPQRIEAPEIKRFAEWAKSDKRQLPIVAVTTDPHQEVPLLDPISLQRLLLGIGQVVLLPKSSAFELTSLLSDMLGGRRDAKQWGVYNGAVRVYWPGVDVMSDADSPFAHRLWIPDEHHKLPRGIEDDLLKLLAWATVHRKYLKWVDYRSIERKRDIEDLERLSKQSVAPTSTAALERLQNDVLELKQQLDASEAALKSERANAEAAWSQLRECEATNRRLREARSTSKPSEDEPGLTDAESAVHLARLRFPGTLIFADDLHIATRQDGDFWFRVFRALNDLVAEAGAGDIETRVAELLRKHGHNGKRPKHGDSQEHRINPASGQLVHLRWRLHMKSGSPTESESIYWDFLQDGRAVLIGRIGQHAE